MAPKFTEKQHPTMIQLKPAQSFYISAQSLCNNKRLKRRRLRQAEKLRAYNKIQKKNNANNQKENLVVQKLRQKRFHDLQPAVTIDLLSDEEQPSENRRNANGLMPDIQQSVANDNHKQQGQKTSAWVGLDVERARILGLMPVSNNLNQSITAREKRRRSRRKCRNRSIPQTPHPAPSSVQLSGESIILSDDSRDEPSANSIPEYHHPDYNKQDTFLSQNSIQVDEVTVSLVPRTVTSSNSDLRNSQYFNGSTPFPMLPDETVVQTIVADRMYELSLNKLREDLAKRRTIAFIHNQSPSKISTQRRKNVSLPSSTIGMKEQTLLHSTPIPLKLSSDLSISLISDDDDDNDDDEQRRDYYYNRRERMECSSNDRQRQSFHMPSNLQKLPINASVSVSLNASGLHQKIPRRKLG